MIGDDQALEPAGGGDPERPDTVPPPSAGDILCALRDYGWPTLTIEGHGVIAGEVDTRAYLAEASSAERLELWEGLQGFEQDDEP